LPEAASNLRSKRHPSINYTHPFNGACVSHSPSYPDALHTCSPSPCRASPQKGPFYCSSSRCLPSTGILLQVCLIFSLSIQLPILNSQSLPILTPNIPESGTKSRVETQVRVTVDLAHASSSSGEPYQYDRVGSWKWLTLPPGTFTKKRTRREGKIGDCDTSFMHCTH